MAQAVAPLLGWKLPALQLAHSGWPSYCCAEPGEQGVQIAAPEELEVPVGQSVHELVPLVVNLPAGQMVH